MRGVPLVPSANARDGLRRLIDRYYPTMPGGERFRDGNSPFYNWLRSSLSPHDRVLNIGAGATPTQAVRRLGGGVAKLAGVDVEPSVLGNEDLDEAHLIDGVHLPYPEAYFDAAYSDWTMEHVEHPDLLLREIHRVLRPGASYWFKTSNLHHYVTFVSAVTPHRFHDWLLRTSGIITGTQRPWPTYYRSNTRARVLTLASRAGFCQCELRMVEPEPTYLTFSRLAFLLGVGYERLVNSREWLTGFRLILLAKATKES